MAVIRPAYIYDSTTSQWVQLGQSALNPVQYQSTKPATPSNGDIWVDSSDSGLTLVSTTGTIGTVSGSGPYTATITGMQTSSTAKLTAGVSRIKATSGTGNLGSGIVTVTSIVSGTSITISSTLSMTAGTITNMYRYSSLINQNDFLLKTDASATYLTTSTAAATYVPLSTYNAPAFVAKVGGDIVTASASGVIPITLKGATFQSANLLEFRNSSNSLLGYVNNNGIPYFPGQVVQVAYAQSNGASTALSTGGTIGTVTGTSNPYTATITGMSTTTGLTVGGTIKATAGTGNLGTGMVTITQINSGTSINISATSVITAGTITAILYGSPTYDTIASAELAAIPGLSIDFAPKFATSKILLTAMINSTSTYVCTFGFLKNNASPTGVPGNSNVTSGSIATSYSGQGTTVLSNMYNNYISYLDSPGTTSMVNYKAAATSSWAGATYTLYINDRSSFDMRSLSSLTIMEIAA